MLKAYGKQQRLRFFDQGTSTWVTVASIHWPHPIGSDLIVLGGKHEPNYRQLYAADISNWTAEMKGLINIVSLENNAIEVWDIMRMYSI